MGNQETTIIKSKKKLRVLVACEESQVVCIAFRNKGHEAYSCDLQECSGGHPEWHIKGDVIPIAYSGEWDLMIGHPPCTYLTCRAQSHNIRLKRNMEKNEAITFFIKLINAPIEKIAIENPKGIMNTMFRKPDQIIQPLYFGDPYRKMTCLWLKNLPLLVWSKNDNLFERRTVVDEEIKYHNKKGHPIHWVDSLSPSPDRQKIRSKTFPGIANAMAEQWNF